MFVVVVLRDLPTEYVMLSPWRHIQNSRHYNVKVLSFVIPWEKSRQCVLGSEAWPQRCGRSLCFVSCFSLYTSTNFVSLLGARVDFVETVL